MSFLIRLEGVASPCPPEFEVGSIVEIADRLGVGVITNVNGAEAFAFPGEPPDEVVRRWRRAELDNKRPRRRR